jgi:N-hydroxyarylamine O-acetyltransferase
MIDARPGLDLDAYFARIGYDGPRSPSLAVLRTLHRLHPAAIPFENLTPLMGDPVPLELRALQAKLVGGGRGGYCYEHNGLFRAVLETLGFAVTPLAARVLWGQPADAPTRPLSHMLLRVDMADGPWIVDVGFGGAVMTAPLRLDPDADPAGAPEAYRLLAGEEGECELQMEAGGDWRALYRFDLTPRTAADYATMNAFSATDPSSLFVSGLLAARTLPQGRLALSNTRFTVRQVGKAPVERTLASIQDLKAVLAEDFGLTLPDGIDRIGPKLGL